MRVWRLAYDGYDPAEEGQREALCTLGNGFFATRGAAPESRADGVHNPGTYAAGCYNRLRDEIAGHVVENESMVNLPNWLMLTFAIDEGPWFELDHAEVLSFGQELDLRRGILTRRMRVRDPGGRCTQLIQRRFVHMEQSHLAGLETTFTALNWSGRLRVRSGVDGGVENTGVKRYRNLSSRHLTTLAAQPRDQDVLLLVAETSQSHLRVAVGARNRIVRNNAPGAAEWSVVQGANYVAHDLAIDVVAGEQLAIEKIAALYTSRDRAVSEPSEAAVGELGQAGSFDMLLERHVLAWTHLWQHFHVELTDGDEISDETLQTVHLHLFHLLQTVVAEQHRPGCGRAGARVARRGISRACVLGRALRSSRSHAPRTRPHPSLTALSAPATTCGAQSRPGRRIRRRHVSLAVGKRRERGQPTAAPQPAVRPVDSGRQPSAATCMPRGGLHRMAVLRGNR